MGMERKDRWGTLKSSFWWHMSLIGGQKFGTMRRPERQATAALKEWTATDRIVEEGAEGRLEAIVSKLYRIVSRQPCAEMLVLNTQEGCWASAMPPK